MPDELQKCSVCGTLFKPCRKGNSVCPDPTCKREANRRSCADRRKRKGTPLSTVMCAMCGKAFQTRNPKQAKYCCKACKKKADHIREQEENERKRWPQPCWRCSRTYRDICVWIAFDKPVPGWTATPTPEIKAEDGTVYKMASYEILNCPQYLADEVKHAKLD